jgi:ABC-type nitrate/sulfonate/bicarbonate transport system substrate-binding protein
MSVRPRFALLLALFALAAGGCGAGGGHSDSRPDQDATLLLDGRPGAVDAGLYLAMQRGYDDAEGVHLRAARPFGTASAVKALLGGQADMAIVDLHDLALARERGQDVVAVMALVQTPLPSELARRRDRAGRVDAAGAPPYPELVLAASREALDTNGPVIRATVRALRRGYEATIDDPASAVTALTDAESSLERATVSRQLDAVSPSFTAGARFFGELDPGRLAAWAAWEQKVGIVKRRPDVARAFDPATAAAGRTTDPDA